MGLLHPFRDHRRKALGQQSFPPEWTRIIEESVPYCRSLDPEERERLEDLVKVFIAEKYFEGCGGLVVTDQMKVTIAAQACLLLLNLRHNYYERLVTILIYPESFSYAQEERDPLGTVTVTQLPVSGLSSSGGAVVLSWPDTLAGALQPHDGTNVVLHEFAHQLDLLDGSMNGAPALDTSSHYRAWARVLGEQYRELQAEVERHTPSIISAYGATKPAEFFAVVTELFFERPLELRQHHPALYNEFLQYYRQDPAARL